LETKRVLGVVFSLGLKEGRATQGRIGQELGIDMEWAKQEIQKLVSLGLLKSHAGKVSLTEKGRRSIRVVFIGGGFEVIHSGHLHTIEKAKAHGDVLVVSVARDSTIRRRKNREPVADEDARVELLSSLRQVDAAILGVEGNIYDTLEKVGPDVVALGYDQYHLESEVEREGRRRGLKLKVVRLDSPYPKLKTSALLREF
jgi:FAD synthetase